MKAIIVLVAVIAAAALASSAGASASYMNPWPAWFKQAVVGSCMNNGVNPLRCGCYLRRLQQRWTFSQAYAVEMKIDNGDYVPTSARRIIAWAGSGC